MLNFHDASSRLVFHEVVLISSRELLGLGGDFFFFFFFVFLLDYCTFDDLLSFLQICEIGGFIEITVPLEQIREKVCRNEWELVAV